MKGTYKGICCSLHFSCIVSDNIAANNCTIPKLSLRGNRRHSAARYFDDGIRDVIILWTPS